tara:strand:+ start:632 stop:1276 length:645 start_codon:yes stop_codon:yes gene_type:complete
LKLKLYTNSHSVSCSKIEVAIDYKSLEIEKLEAINNYGVFSPTATVPCLSINEMMISNSSAILEFLEDSFPDPTLLSKNPEVKAKIRFMSTLVDEKLVNTIRKLFGMVKNSSHPSDGVIIENIFKDLSSNLNLVFKIKGEDIFLANSSISFADCNTPSFFSMLKEFEKHFNKEVNKSDQFLKYEDNLQNHNTLNKEYKRYGFEIRNWISNKLLA